MRHLALLRAADQVDRLTRPEAARLLRQAASTIRDLTALVSASGQGAGVTPEIAFRLDEM